MSEKNTTDEEPVEPSVNEDFDFGEAEASSKPSQSAPSSGSGKKFIVAMFILVLAVIGIMGYKIFKPVKSQNLAVASQANQAATPPLAAEPTNTKPTPLPITPPTQSHAEKPAASHEQNFGDIATAFATNDTHNTHQQGNINDLKKELFSPEKTTSHTNTDTVTKENIPNNQELTKLSDGLNKLNHQIDSIMNQIKYLDSYSREVSDNLNKLNDSISAMDNRISALINTTSSLSKDVGTVRSEMGHVKQVLRDDGLDVSLNASVQKKKPETTGGNIALEEPEYTVHAVIPGRAWLKSSKGQIVTVAEGDTIGNYGKVLVIDAANGVVLTSSGIAFR